MCCSSRSASHHSPVRWGLVGCGEMMQSFIVPALQSIPHARIVACVSSSASSSRSSRLWSLVSRHPSIRLHASLESLLSDSSVDAIYIASPTGSRLDMTRRICASAASASTAASASASATSARSRKPCIMQLPMARSVFWEQRPPHWLRHFICDKGDVDALATPTCDVAEPLI